MTRREALWEGLYAALIPHKNHDGIPGDPTICVRCRAEGWIEELKKEEES